MREFMLHRFRQLTPHRVHFVDGVAGKSLVSHLGHIGLLISGTALQKGGGAAQCLVNLHHGKAGIVSTEFQNLSRRGSVRRVAKDNVPQLSRLIGEPHHRHGMIMRRFQGWIPCHPTLAIGFAPGMTQSAPAGRARHRHRRPASHRTLGGRGNFRKRSLQKWRIDARATIRVHVFPHGGAAMRMGATE